jgi:hypothetical protein
MCEILFKIVPPPEVIAEDEYDFRPPRRPARLPRRVSDDEFAISEIIVLPKIKTEN